MTNTIVPVSADPGRIEEFIEGVYGKNREANKKAYERAALVLTGVVAYGAYKTAKRGRN